MTIKHTNLIHMALNAVTLTIFVWLQMIVFEGFQGILHEGAFVLTYFISLGCVPLLWWGLFPRIK